MREIEGASFGASSPTRAPVPSTLRNASQRPVLAMGMDQRFVFTYRLVEAANKVAQTVDRTTLLRVVNG